MLKAERILKYLSAPLKITVFDTLESTNRTARELAKSNNGEQVIIARSQTGGRGRMGRSFFSPDGGLYMSLLLYPDMMASAGVMITAAAAVAVARAIDSAAGTKSEIKWVNDVYLGGKKVCGILTEAQTRSDGSIEYAVLGIGINLVAPDGGFPEDIAGRAGAVFDTLTDDADNKLAATVINEFTNIMRGGFDKAGFLDEYRSRSCVIGHAVDVMRIADGEATPAFAVGIDDDCRLIVRFANGTEEALGSGEVSIREK